MRVVLATFGSTGDVQPLLVLAAALRSKGHVAVLALPPNYEEAATGAGETFVPIGPRVDLSVIRAANCGMVGSGDTADHVRRFLDIVVPAAPALFRDLCAAAQAADVLVGPPFLFPCRMVHETLGVPYVSIHLSHLGELGSRTLRGPAAASINAVRATARLPALADPLGVDGRSDRLALYCVSSVVMRKPSTWPPWCHVVGFLHDGTREWQVDPALRAFVESGAPPVVVSFGSAMHDDPDAVTKAIVEAIEDAGCRAVLQRGWSGLGGGTLPASIHVTGTVPHDWLFPRASLAVVHGGVGTFAAALRASIPMIVVPHMLDQPVWGALGQALGSVTAVIPFGQLTRASLGSALRDALGRGLGREPARRIAERLRAENGVERACTLIEELARPA